MHSPRTQYYIKLVQAYQHWRKLSPVQFSPQKSTTIIEKTKELKNKYKLHGLDPKDDMLWNLVHGDLKLMELDHYVEFNKKTCCGGLHFDHTGTPLLDHQICRRESAWREYVKLRDDKGMI